MGILFLNTVKQVGIFIICAQAVMHFKRNESYEKYLKLLVSMMVMVQLLIPVFSMFKAGSADGFSDRIAAYSKQLETNIEEIEFIEILAEEKVKEMTLEEVEERIRRNQEEESGEENIREEEERKESSHVIRIEDVEVRTDE